MPEAADRYYRPSNTAPISGIFTMLTVGGLAAVVMGPIYALVSFYDPFVVFSLFGALSIGALGGSAVDYGARVGKVRNRVVVHGVSIVVGLFLVYVSWVAYIGLLTGSIILSPQIIWQVIQIIAQQGVWEFNGEEPLGAELYVIWVCEAVMICGLVIVSGYRKRPPYCEACGRWSEAMGLEVRVSSECRDELVQVLETERYSALMEFRSEIIHDSDYIQLTPYQCPGCDESCFLSGWRVITEINKQGAWETRTLDLFKDMIVPREIIDGLTALPQEVPEDDEGDPSEDGYGSAEPEAVDD
ncbi:hypothetical protein Pan258_54750 [Symmachiella dynata]|uniref:hypothetical protein n=1 Tax=Symmachiella dynata TaxID=2527995 RepID=UPI001189EA61|nr:hypothetical protein [Symmachiella dynata]QDT51386.1 hypothetical protein Pan258_54750 [Symmachiella dynata]